MLNTKQRPRAVVTPDGRHIISPWPVTREGALAENVACYYPMTPCPVHGGEPEGKLPTVFVTTGIYGCCAQRNAVSDFNAALNRGEPTEPGRAHEMGLDYYWSYHSHKQCGHSGKRLLNGRCYECGIAANSPSPRQVAIANSLDWYTPAADDPCPNGHTSERRVNNGGCKQCEQDKKGAAKALPMHKDPQFANFIMSRDAARGLGLKLYRTGLPCVAGHIGWRYTSTGGCLTCMGR